MEITIVQASQFQRLDMICNVLFQMLGVWCVNEWHNLCAGQSVQVVELGPGRGTLAEDLLRVS